MWRETTKHERNLKIWREELDGLVPEKVLDFHVHVFNEAAVPKGKPFPSGGHPIPGYTFEELSQDLSETYPGRETSAVCFGLPDVDYDQASNDRYVAAGADGERWYGLRLIGPSEDPEKVRADVIAGGFFGLKPYPVYVRKENVADVEVHEMLPAGIMEVANDLGLAIMLHIPRGARLADPLNQKQVAGLCTTYPNAKIVLAHIGRAYYYKSAVGHLDQLKGLDNLWFDTAMVTNADVIEYAFRTVRQDRVLYGTDVPIALAPGHSVEINNQYTYVTPVKWDLSISDDHGKLVFTSFLYEELRAIKKAVDRLGLSHFFRQDFFHNNGRRLLESIPRR